jgi:hypothetical protein
MALALSSDRVFDGLTEIDRFPTTRAFQNLLEGRGLSEPHQLAL